MTDGRNSISASTAQRPPKKTSDAAPTTVEATRMRDWLMPGIEHQRPHVARDDIGQLIRNVLQEFFQALAGRGLVVGDEDADHARL